MTLDEILSDLYLRLHTADEACGLIGGRSTRTFPPNARRVQRCARKSRMITESAKVSGTPNSERTRI